MTACADVYLKLATRRATKQLARALAENLQPGDLVILNGELGAGKTFFVRALCRALNLPESVPVVSPTFPLIRELETTPPIVHADLYRLERLEEAYELGFEEYREQGNILLVEWGDRFAPALGGDALHLTIVLDPRRAFLTAEGSRSSQLQKAVNERLKDLQKTPNTTEQGGKPSR